MVSAHMACSGDWLRGAGICTNSSLCRSPVTDDVLPSPRSDDFELQCRIQNKPYDIFGTWFNNEYVISGELHWLSHTNAVSESKLWLNKVMLLFPR